MSYQSALREMNVQCNWPSWTDLDYCKCENIEKDTALYSAVLDKMSFPLKRAVTKIVKVNCPFLHGNFLVRKAEYASRGYGNHCVHELVHATAASSIDSILRNNLDWRKVTRAKFGLGVSFSNDPCYANKEASRRIGSYRAMIVADVLVGLTREGQSYMSLPPPGYDTTTGRSKVYVKYYDDEFLPKYIIYYTH